MGRDQGGAGAAEEVEHDVAAPRHVPDRIGNHLHRLDGGMQGKLFHPPGVPRVDASILTDIGAVAPVLTQLESVDMGRAALLEDEDQLVARAVETAHPAIVLGPDDQVLHLVIDRTAGGEDLGQVAPVHADEVDRPVHAVIGQKLECGGQETCELLGRHLGRGHRELAVLHLARIADMAVDRHVVGRVRGVSIYGKRRRDKITGRG